MLVCVDGTGASDRAAYAHDFANSFVNRVKLQYLRAHPPPEPPPIHHRGPGDDWSDGVRGLFGGEHHVSPSFLADEVVRLHTSVSTGLGEDRDAMPSWQAGRPVSSWAPEETEAFELIQQRRQLFMVGHSRGAAIIINAARLLLRHGIAVDAMFLFDAVARNPDLDAAAIPCNVRHCYHAMRDPAGGSRGSFGNCGTTAEPGVDFQPRPMRYFFTTHGAMGGTPWGHNLEHMSGTGTFIAEGDPMGSTVITPEAELRGMHEVENWMWPHLRSHGVVP
jgi:hypothetical protein